VATADIDVRPPPATATTPGGENPNELIVPSNDKEGTINSWFFVLMDEKLMKRNNCFQVKLRLWNGRLFLRSLIMNDKGATNVTSYNRETFDALFKAILVRELHALCKPLRQ
jgi:hypothetical protein